MWINSDFQIKKNPNFVQSTNRKVINLTFNHFISVVKIQNVVKSTGEESEEQLREFASKSNIDKLEYCEETYG